jgi:hypothetical protein
MYGATMKYSISRLFVYIMSLGIIACIFVADTLLAQPFGWQYSARLPMQPPTMFIGVDVGISTFSLASAPTFEKSISECDCLTANQRGVSAEVSLRGEYWIDNIAFTGRLGVQSDRIHFAGRNEAFPVRGADSLYVQEQATVSMITLLMSIGAKYVMFPTNFFIRGELNVATRMDDNVQFVREITFQGTERNTIDVQGGTQLLRAGGSLAIGYDYAVAQNMYISSEIFLRRDIQNMLKQSVRGGSSSMTAFGLRVGLLIGLR